jgi:succinoglycan biosynthesis transport protein ExoP
MMAVAMDATAYDARAEAGLVARIRRRKGVFAGVFTAIIALVALLYAILPTSYMAAGAVMVTAFPADVEGGMSNAAEQKLGDPADMDTQIVVARSPRLLQAMLGNPAILRAVHDDCEAVRRTAPVDVLRTILMVPARNCNDTLAGTRASDWLSDHFTIASAGRSRVIQVAYTSHLPAIAATLVNGLIDAYLAQGAADKQVPRVQAETWVRLELSRLGNELRQSELAIENFRRDHGLVRGQVASISSERLTEVSQLLATAEAAEAAAQGRLDQLRSGASDARQALDSRTIADLKQQLSVVSGQVANMSVTFSPHYPGLVALTQQRNDIRQRLAEETARIGPSAQRDYESAAAQVASLRAQMDALKHQVGQGDLAETQIASMVRDNDVKRQLYVNLSNKANDIEAQRRLLTADVQLINYAEVPDKISSPKPLLFALAGLMFASVAAAGAALLRDRSDATVRTDGWLETLSSTPVLGHIPHLPRLGDDYAGSVGSQLTKPSALQEAVRSLYTKCLLLGGAVRPQSLLIASADSGEGKSFLALAMAQFGAATGQRVLVVEGDMRRPGFRAALNLADAPGLAAILGGTCAYAEAVQKTTFGFDVLPAGRATIASTELLSNGRIAALLDWAKERYDLVLIDSPPAQLLMDAQVLASHVDAILCCARWGHSPVGMVVESVRSLREAGGKVIGLAIGMVKPKEYGLYEPRMMARSAYLAPPA